MVSFWFYLLMTQVSVLVRYVISLQVIAHTQHRTQGDAWRSRGLQVRPKDCHLYLPKTLLLITYLPTYLLHGAESFWEANWFSATQEIPHILWNQKVHYRSYNWPPPVPILSQLWVSVTTTWRVLRLRMEERPPIQRVAANILNKQSRTADNGWFFSAGGLGELLRTLRRKNVSCCNQGILYCCRLNLVFRVKCRERVRCANAIIGNSSFITKSGARASISFQERIAFRNVSLLTLSLLTVTLCNHKNKQDDVWFSSGNLILTL